MTVLILGMLLGPILSLFGIQPASMFLITLLSIAVFSHLSVILRFASIYRQSVRVERQAALSEEALYRKQEHTEDRKRKIAVIKSLEAAMRRW